jgi:molybdate transport system substrate-binding protein
VTYVGPLPAEVQNYTVYAGGIGAGARNPAGAAMLTKWLMGVSSDPILKTKGMERPAS